MRVLGFPPPSAHPLGFTLALEEVLSRLPVPAAFPAMMDPYPSRNPDPN